MEITYNIFRQFVPQTQLKSSSNGREKRQLDVAERNEDVHMIFWEYTTKYKYLLICGKVGSWLNPANQESIFQVTIVNTLLSY